jgi:hypothetical protein
MPQVSGGGNTTSDKMSGLAQRQAQILRQREEQYQRVFAPELFAQLQQAAAGAAGKTATPLLQQNAQRINQGFQRGMGQLSEAMAQRGLSGSGMEAGGLAAMSTARTSALSDAYIQAQQSEQARLGSLLQMGGAMSPTPVTASPTQSETNRGTRVAWAGWGAGTPSNA